MTEHIILVAYDWNGQHEAGRITDPGTTGVVVTADGHVIAHEPYRAELLQVGIATYEDEVPAEYYGPAGVC